MSSSAVPFTNETVVSFQQAKTLRYHSDHASITSIDFDDSGLHCLTCAIQDESIQLYDCKTGKHNKTIFSKKYGVNLARFTHHSMNCVYASTKEDDTIRYLSLHDNHYIRYFRGHKDRVVGLEVSPVEDVVLSSSLDHSVRLWDLRSPTCQGLLNIPAPSLIAFDATAMVFAVASQSVNNISLYNVKAYDRRPFASFSLDSPVGVTWTKIEFANTGKLILLSTDGDVHYLLDGYQGYRVAVLRGHVPIAGRSSSTLSHTSFTVDGRYIFGGSGDQNVYVWDTAKASGQSDHLTLRPIGTLTCDQGMPALVAFSPKTMLMATADTGLTFWLPEKGDQ
jgi:COMPASS component SWD2